MHTSSGNPTSAADDTVFSSQPLLPVPADYRTFWSTSLEVPQESIDSLGHMSAAAYPQFVDPAIEAFFEHLFGFPPHDHVAAQYTVRFRREILLARSPIRVYVWIESWSGSTFEVGQVLEDSDGVPCTIVHHRWVAWDRDERRRRPLTPGEQEVFERFRNP